MKTKCIVDSLLLSLLISASSCQSDSQQWEKAIKDPAAAHLAVPSEVQYNWQEMERAMFIQLDPATIQQGEYDNGTTPMSEIKFEKLDVNEWARAAKAWGAKEIIFMLAHSGGFCMWPTTTTEYHIGNTPYKNGKGDVVKEFAEACRKNDLNMGFYCWAPHPQEEEKDNNTVPYNRNVDFVTTREESNKILYKRIEEIVERLGSDRLTEIWVDQPIKAQLGQILKKLMPNAVVQAIGCHDPLPTLRWPGNEKGRVQDPCWSTTTLERMNRRFNTQFEADKNQIQSASDDPDGDYWAPHEADLPLHNHFWHMRPAALKHRRSVEELMDCYIHSVGRNSFLLMNCAPMADGSIHPDDMKRYEEFGAEIDRRFGHPLAVLEQQIGEEFTLKLEKPSRIGYLDTWEAYRYGHRIRSYSIEGFDVDTKQWVKLSEGTAVGRRKIDPVKNSPVISEIRLKIHQHVGTPMLRKLMVHGI